MLLSLKDSYSIFKPGPSVYIFGCVNDSYLTEVLELVQLIIRANSHNTAALAAMWGIAPEDYTAVVL